MHKYLCQSIEKCNEANEVTEGNAILASMVREDHEEKVTFDPRPGGSEEEGDRNWPGIWLRSYNSNGLWDHAETSL